VVVESVKDVIARFAARGPAEPEKPKPPERAKLLPDRHPVRDFFLAEVLDCAVKDDRYSMEHPFFSLSKKPDHSIRHYEHNGVHVTIKPGADGMATIWDKDILIYAVSQLVEAVDQGRAVTRTVRLTAYDLLVATNRGTGGHDYERLVAALERLKGTVVQTDIRTNGARQRDGFNVIDHWRTVERNPSNSRMVAVEITLSEWFYNAAIGREVLTLNRDYFRLDGGLERRLYQLARKHCGHQAQWRIGLDLLHKKTGSTAPLKKFRQMFKRIVAGDSLPDYRVCFDQEADAALFCARG
jgi:plasmid replication initiation protein